MTSSDFSIKSYYAAFAVLFLSLSTTSMAFAACISQRKSKGFPSYRSVPLSFLLSSLSLKLVRYFSRISNSVHPNRVNFRNILYLSHIFVWGFLPFWPSNLIFWGIPKDTKTTNSQHFVYELVGYFYTIY